MDEQKYAVPVTEEIFFTPMQPYMVLEVEERPFFVLIEERFENE